MLREPKKVKLVGEVSFLVHLDQKHYLIANNLDTKIYRLDTHKVVKELDCDNSRLVTHAQCLEQMAVGCENKNIYLFTAKSFFKLAKISVYDDILSLHFVDYSVLLCG